MKHRSTDSDKDEFEARAQHATQGFAAELWYFLMHNKKWWLAPMILVLLLLGALIVFGGSAAAPFIYALF